MWCGFVLAWARAWVAEELLLKCACALRGVFVAQAVS
jgi:hypothetical protein